MACHAPFPEKFRIERCADRTKAFLCDRDTRMHQVWFACQRLKIPQLLLFQKVMRLMPDLHAMGIMPSTSLHHHRACSH
jgi:hypothetical protein